jgi:hypothetical protein
MLRSTRNLIENQGISESLGKPTLKPLQRLRDSSIKALTAFDHEIWAFPGVDRRI